MSVTRAGEPSMISCPPSRASRSCMLNRHSPCSRERIMSSTSKPSGGIALRRKHHAPQENEKNKRERHARHLKPEQRREIPPPPAGRRSRERRRVGPECVAWLETAQLAVLLRVAL